MGAAFLACCLLAVVSSVAGRVEQGPDAAGTDPACGVCIMFLSPIDTPLSQAINNKTGKLGFSHCCIDACEVDEKGVRVCIDCTIGKGVYRAPVADVTADRKCVRVFLPLVEGKETYGCARSKVGQRYSVGSLAGASWGTGTTCAEMVADCLPTRIGQAITRPHDRALAPNDIARFFGVSGPDSPDMKV